MGSLAPIETIRNLFSPSQDDVRTQRGREALERVNDIIRLLEESSHAADFGAARLNGISAPEELVSQAWMQLPSPAWILRASGEFLMVNLAFSKWYGKPASMVVGKTISEVWGYEGSHEFFEANRAVFVDARPIYAVERLWNPKAERAEDCLAHKYPVIEPGTGEMLLGGTVVVERLTERAWGIESEVGNQG